MLFVIWFLSTQRCKSTDVNYFTKTTSIFYLQLSYTTDDFFPLGENWFSCLQEALTQSHSALIVLTPNLLRANWKLYQLEQAVCTKIEQHNFRVVFLLCEKLACFGNLPKYLRQFLQRGATVKKYRKNWKDTLIYELKRKKKNKRSVNVEQNGTEPMELEAA